MTPNPIYNGIASVHALGLALHELLLAPGECLAVPTHLYELNERAKAIDEADSEKKNLDDIVNDRDRLQSLLNSPHTADFLESTRIEVAHQVERWGTVHDRAKDPADWYWLLAYLSGKALASHIAGDAEKAKHHTISSAAVLANWHAAITCADNRMAPGSGDLQRFLQERFGDVAVGGHCPDAST